MAEKRLWVVTVEAEIVVLAENEADAREVGEEVVLYNEAVPEVTGASEMTYLPGEWHLHAIPWGAGDKSDPDRTIGKWVELGAAPKYSAMVAKLKEK